MEVTRLAAPALLPCDPACSVVRDGVVDIGADGRITWCGPRSAAPVLPASAAVRELDGLLLPGLVNAHCHTPMTVLRGMGGDLPLLRWLTEVMWPAEAKLTGPDVRAGMLLGCVELLRAGVIQVQNAAGTYVPYNLNTMQVTVRGVTYQPATCAGSAAASTRRSAA